jgi:hypothetical protein
MEIFGFEIKWPRTRYVTIKEMLREEGSFKTKKYMMKEMYFNKFIAEDFIGGLIRKGCIDLDLVRLRQISGIFALRKKLLSVYGLNPNELKAYMLDVKKYIDKKSKV